MTHPPGRRPDVSLVIVSYHCRDLLQECLESVDVQRDDLDLEVFVVDNASSDGTAEMVAREFPWVDFTDTGANLGFAKPNNMALRRCAAPTILILNPDTVIPSGGLMRCVNELQARPDIGMLTPRLVTRTGELDRRCKRGFPTPWSSFCYFTGLDRVFKGPRSTRYTMGTLGEHEVGLVEAISGAFMLVRAEVLDQVGLFDEQFFMYAEDIDLSLRITEAGWGVLYWPMVDVIHVGAGSNSGGVRPPAADAAYFRTMAPFIRKHRPGLRGRLLAVSVRVVSELMYGASKARAQLARRKGQGR